MVSRFLNWIALPSHSNVINAPLRNCPFRRGYRNKNTGAIKNHGTIHPMQHPPSGCHGFHVTEDRGAIVVATRGSHLTDLPDLYLSDVRRPRVVGMERGPAHVGVVPEDD